MSISKQTLDIEDDDGQSLRNVNAKVTGTRRRFKLDNTQTCSVQVVVAKDSGSGNRSIWYLKVSNDGANFNALPTGNVSITAPGISECLDVSGYKWLEVFLGGAGSTYTTESVNLIVCKQS